MSSEIAREVLEEPEAMDESSDEEEGFVVEAEVVQQKQKDGDSREQDLLQKRQQVHFLWYDTTGIYDELYPPNISYTPHWSSA